MAPSLRSIATALLSSTLAPWWGGDTGDGRLVYGYDPDPDLSDLASKIGKLANETLFWGPYKPNLYFGVRPRTPHGLWTGLLWTRIDDYNDMQREFRYTCEQNQGIHGYGWDEFDARTGGVQTIHDDANKIDITTTFVKIPAGGWAARIRGVPRATASDASQHTTLLHLYVGQESSGGELGVDGAAGDRLGYAGDVSLAGRSQALGEFGLRVTQGTGAHPADDHPIMSPLRRGDRMVVQSLKVPAEALWNAKQVVYGQIQGSLKFVQDNMEQAQFPPPWMLYVLEHRPGTGNAHIVQRVFRGEFEFDVIFSSRTAATDTAAAATATSEDVTRAITAMRDGFRERFASVFRLRAPYDADEYVGFGKSMLSNLVGGIGYFHGEQLVDRSGADEYDEDEEGFWQGAEAVRARRDFEPDGPYELFTSIPSRPFFPRGFLWDEGFHLLPISDWDMDLVLEIVGSWLGLMDDDGWIAREQILGPEARSKVPEQFQVQYPHYANPPTLFLVVDAFVERLRGARGGKEKRGAGADGNENTDAPPGGTPLRTAYLDNPELGKERLRELYPLLRRQYEWFRRTQAGDLRSYDRVAFSMREAYRWRGRTETHILTSGLDDYPRPSPPHPGELHVDLMSWVGLMTRSLADVADELGMAEDAAGYRTTLHAIGRNLDDLHWSEADGCFCDATIDAYEENALVCHKGYVSLFPFLTGLLEAADPKLGKTLDLIGDEAHLFSPHGLRSLSKSDPLYGTGENYWRSPVWININYLALAQLRAVARKEGPYRARAAELHNRLRRNVVDTVYESWAETGFAWEQYDPETGRGRRTQHFTGWTSLVVKIMAEEEITLGGEAAVAEPVGASDGKGASDEKPAKEAEEIARVGQDGGRAVAGAEKLEGVLAKDRDERDEL